MRNLKKFLALALAVMMTLSLMVTANAAIDTSAAVTDKDSITEEFKEAVAVLNGLKIITGYETGDKQYEFRPEKPISRQEATALVYRLHSGDADNVKNNLYSTADNIAKFKDVNPNGAQQWSAGYIGYCANQEIIKGVSANRFNPTGNVTGYQMLAMVLRAIGYGQNGEYEGSGWQTRVATTATKLGMLKNIDDTNYAGTLSAPATRELVAEIVFQAALQGTVTYTPAFGYQEYGDASLGVQKFQLNCGNYTVIDKWGRPGYYWFQGSTVKSDLSNVVATIKALPVKTYDTTVRECDVAHDLGITEDAAYSLYVNNNEAITDNYLIVATDTVTKVGGQGRITEFYGKLYHPHKNNTWEKSVVMIDTFLAKVTKVEDRVLDAKEHVMIPAKLYVNVYDSFTDTETGGTPVVLEKNDANWAFAKGDFITLNAYTDNENGIDANDVSSRHDRDDAERNEAAFEAEKVKLKTDNKTLEYYANVAKAVPVLGKQTTIYWNQGKHNVDNVDKLDQLDLHLDVAGTTTNTTFAWYYDAKGNLIGIGNVPNTINYGVITSIYSAFKQGDSQTDGTAVAIATVKYADGTEGTVTIDRFLVNSGALGNGIYGAVAATTSGHANVNTEMVDQTNGVTNNGGSASAELLPAYDNGAASSMTATPRSNAANAKNAVQAGWLNIAPVAGLNASAEKALTGAKTPWGNVNNGAPSTGGSYGIIRGNLFKFVNSADGYITAIEVAGDGNTTTNNTGVYVGHYNKMTATNSTSELVKNYAYLNVNGTTIRMDDDTKIVVRGCTVDANGDIDETSNTIDVYDGIDALPSSINVAGSSEVDWADTDSNGIADVVYVYGVKKGATTFGLFYYNGGAGRWDGNEETGSGYLHGWLDGKETDLYFDNKAEFDLVQQSTILYGGHLFAVRMFDGVVDNLMGRTASTHNKDWILATGATSNVAVPNGGAITVRNMQLNTNITNGNLTLSNTADFGVGMTGGVDNGNDYTANTKAIWLHDDGNKQNTDNAPGEQYTDVRYNSSNNSIEVANYTVSGGKIVGSLNYTSKYYLTGSSAQLGDALYFLNMEGRVNDVTIVFEDGTNGSVRQIYVTTRPDITPPGGEGSNPSNLATSLANSGNNAVVLTNANDTTLAAAIKSGLNIVIATPGATGISILPDSNGIADKLLYFPAGNYGANTPTLDLEIVNSSGQTIFRDSVTGVANQTNFFYVNYQGGPNSGITMNGGFVKGDFTFVIRANNGTEIVTVSQGSFTLK